MSNLRQPSPWSANLVSVTGQVGCLTVLLIVGALLAGRWLDAQLDTRPWFTVGLLLGSVPMTLVLTIRLVLRATKDLTAQMQPKRNMEENASDDDGDNP